MSARHVYFAYGSNMDAAQMVSRCPSAERVGLARLPGHRLCFPVKGAYRPGGVASVEVCAHGSDVWGVVWTVDDSDLLKLDEIEVRSVYDRRTMEVLDEAGRSVAAQVYRAYPQGRFAPDGPYLELIIAAARMQGIDPSYVRMLEGWR